ncbi:MAG: hypothetical protein IPM66_17670 [Acidobacteriota bacterium]|nr:MAG: hypothetical protein IPM66_17670 [Acidobacteriota bacterium]
MTEEKIKLTNAYRRAAIGLAAAAILWITAFLFGGLDDSPANWLIPIAAAALSVFFFAFSRKTTESEK